MKTKCPTLNVFKSSIGKLTGLVLTILVLGGLTEAKAQTCPLACNDLVQVSVDVNCKAEITPDMLLESPGPGNCNYVVVLYDENDQPLPDDTVRYAQVGTTIKARVTLGANSCWSNIQVEDKMPPQVICADPDVVMCNDTAYDITPDIVMENCGIADTVVLSDNFIDYPCDSIYSGVRVICRYYVDESGNHSDTCCHEVFFARPSLVDIAFPGDTTFPCTNFPGADPAITGVPTWNDIPLYPDRGVCEINIDYTDDTISICPESYKIIREWLIFDWCLPSNNGNPRLGIQVIKVSDEDGPIVYCPTTDVAPDTVSSDVYTCTGTYLLPEPHVLMPGQPIVDSGAIYIISECSNTSYSVRHLAADSPDNCVPGRGLPTADHVRFDPTINRWIATDLPLGCNWFYYTFTDECGNSTECTFDIYVEDNTPPNAICDEFTVASLGIDGTTKVYATSLDDGSWDNCEIETMLARRMDRGNPCGANEEEFREYIEFCCNDVGFSRMVEFMVVDKAGNTNICMVEVEIQDKIPPIVTCPPNITVSCQFDLSDLSVFGTIVNAKFNQVRNPIVIDDPYVQFDGAAIDGEFYDNCLATFDVEEEINIECGNGYIDRIFTVTDRGNLTAQCTQRITVIDFEPFVMDPTDWPDDYTSTTDCSTGTETDPDVTGRPFINEGGCGDIFVGHEDQTFNKEPDACVKILRKWTVIDWCYYDPNDPNTGGIWEHTQVIKINNNVPPTITSNCDDRMFELYGADCTEEIQLTASAMDDCTAEEDLRWAWEIDLNEDGISDVRGTGNDVVRNYEPGTYTIWWNVRDICDNESECHYTFTVEDKKNPSPYCRDAVVTVIMESSLMIEIWASDFNIASEDNCTAQEDLEFAFFINNQFQPNMVFDCSHIGVQTIRMYVIDEAGNYDYCEVEIEIQDPNNLCGTNGFVGVGGSLQARNGDMVEGVEVNIQRMNGGVTSKTDMSDATGRYSFDNISKNANYRIVANKNDDVLNGVTTKDLVLIQRYLLGLEPLVSPLQLIAADANNTEEVTAADIAAIRKVILGVEASFDNGQTSWRFVNGGTTFADPQNPWPFEESIEYYDISRDQMDSNFDAVKIGDVDGDVVGNSNSLVTRSKEVVNLTVEDASFDQGETVYIPVYLENAQDVNGLQLTLQMGEDMRLIGIEDGTMEICDQCYHIDGQTLTMSWFDLEPVYFNQEDAIFTVVAEAYNSGELSNELMITSDVTASILFADLTAEEAQISMKFTGNSATEGEVELYQNVPNPFTASTVIGFELPGAEDVRLTIFDVTGKVLKVLDGHFDRGYHEFVVTGEELNVEGVLYYQLTAGTFSSTRKMLMVR